MNNPNNLLNMMQTGGQASSAGGTSLIRALQRRSDMKKLERQQKKEARRQKRGGLFGSLGSIAGGLLGAALAPATGGASLALFSGLGSAAGKRVGEGLGAGKSKSYDSSGTVYGQQSFKDLDQASSDYTRGMGERALVSGLQTALTAGLSPSGGIYGKVGGKLRTLPGSGSAVGAVTSSAIPTASTKGLEAMESFLSQVDTSGNPVPLPFGSKPNFVGSSFLTSPNLSTASTASTDSYFDPSSLSPYLSNYEDGGLAAYQTGGFTASSILKQQGLDPTQDQLMQFQAFDPTQIQQAKTGAEQSLMSMTGGMGLSSAGGGFGAKQRAATSAIGAGQDLIGDTTEQAQRSFESQTLGTAADLINQEVEFKELAANQQDFGQLYGVDTNNEEDMLRLNEMLQTKVFGLNETTINGNLHVWDDSLDPPQYRPA